MSKQTATVEFSDITVYDALGLSDFDISGRMEVEVEYYHDDAGCTGEVDIVHNITDLTITYGKVARNGREVNFTEAMIAKMLKNKRVIETLKLEAAVILQDEYNQRKTEYRDSHRSSSLSGFTFAAR